MKKNLVTFIPGISLVQIPHLVKQIFNITFFIKSSNTRIECTYTIVKRINNHKLSSLYLLKLMNSIHFSDYKIFLRKYGKVRIVPKQDHTTKQCCSDEQKQHI